jgi:hypothetical protein
VNDTERAQWVDNDEGLYSAWKGSGLSKRVFISRNREDIDAAIGNVRTGRQPAHYLRYGGNPEPARPAYGAAWAAGRPGQRNTGRAGQSLMPGVF